MFRFIKNIIVLVFFITLPLLAKYHYSSPQEREQYISWIQRFLDGSLEQGVQRAKQEITQLTPEKLMTRIHQGAEQFQQVANCGKTETLEVKEGASSAIYRWVDDEGQVHFSDQDPGKLRNSEKLAVHYPDRKRYFSLKLIEDTTSLPAFTRDKVSADVRQIYRILSREMQLDHLRQVMLNVRVIETQQAFQEYKSRVAPQISTNSGFYTSKDNEAVVFQGQNPEAMRAVVRHEASHVIVAGLYGFTPVWFNEGLAEYFEYLEISGQLRQISPVPHHLAYLKNSLSSGSLMALKDYIALSLQQWYGGNLEANYAQAWSMVYFLMSHRDGKQLLRGMMNSMAENYCWQFSSTEYLEQHYPGGLAGLEQQWLNWLSREVKPHRY